MEDKVKRIKLPQPIHTLLLTLNWAHHHKELFKVCNLSFFRSKFEWHCVTTFNL